MSSESTRFGDPVDIIMATYNGEQFLAEQLDSLISQTYTNWRILASDDGSKDATMTILSRYAQNDNRIQLCVRAEPFHDATLNFLSLLKETTAEMVMFCDQDDVWYPNKVEKAVVAYCQDVSPEAKERPQLICFDSCVVNEDLSCLCESFQSYANFSLQRINSGYLLAQNVTQGCTTLINRSLVELMLKEKLIASSEKIGIYDWWISRIAVLCGEVHTYQEQTMFYRQHATSVVGAQEYSVKAQRLKLSKSFNSMRQAAYQVSLITNGLKQTIPDDRLRVAEAFANAFRISRIQRVVNAFKYRFWKKGFLRKAVQLFVLILARREKWEK